MTTTTRQAMQRVHQASSGLAQAERLFQILHKASQEDSHNFCIEQALEKAMALCCEMEDDMIAEMENAISAGVDPDEFN